METRKRERIIVGICALAIFLYAIRNVMQLSMPYILDDEFGYWSVGAWIAGYDWSGVTKWCGYYSYGYGFILAIFIKIAGRLSLAYKMAICFNGVLLAGCFIIVKKLICLLMPEMSFTKTLLLTLLLTLMPNNLYQANIAWTELLLSFNVWLMLYLLALYIKRTKVRYLYAMSLLVVYSYMVHNRLLVAICAFLLIVLLLTKEKKMSLRQVAVILGCVVVGIFLAQILKKYFYINVWKSSRVAAGNSYTYIIKNLIKSLSDWNSVKELFTGILGKWFYFSTALLNIGILGLYAWLKSLKGKAEEALYLHSFVWIAFGLEIMLTVLQMYGHVTQSLNPLLYGRYADIFVGPALMIIIYSLIHVLQDVKHSKMIWMIQGTFVLHLIMAVPLRQTIENQGLVSFGSMNLIFLQPYWNGNSLNMFEAVFVSSFLGLCICLSMWYINSTWQYLMGTTCLLCGVNIVNAQIAVDTSIITFAEEQSYARDAASELVAYENKNAYYFVNGKNVWDNRMKNLIQFYDADIMLTGQRKFEKFVEQENIVVASRNHPELLELMFEKYEMVYQNSDVIFLKKSDEVRSKYAKLGCSNFVLGENAGWKDYTVATLGNTGMYIQTVPYQISAGSYMTEFAFEMDGETKREGTVGTIAVICNGEKIAEQELKFDGKEDQITVQCPFEVKKDAELQVEIDVYDDVFLEFNEGSIYERTIE